MEALLEAPVLDAGAGEAKGVEEVGEALEGDEAGVIGEGGDPSEEVPVGPVGGGDIRLGGREVDSEVGVGAEMGFADYGGERDLLIGKAAEDQGLGSEEESWSPSPCSKRGLRTLPLGAWLSSRRASVGRPGAA